MALSEKAPEYWIEHIIGNLYAVKRDNGNYSVIVFEGTKQQCENWINH